MCLQQHERSLTGLAEKVSVLDWDSGIPESRSTKNNPLLPDLTKAEGFTEWIKTGWGEADRNAPVDPESVASARNHRNIISQRFPGKTVAITSGRAQLRANDTFFEFRADSDFLWMVGHGIENSVLVMTPASSGHDSTLYVIPPARPGETDFFKSAISGELWVGPIAGVAEWRDALSIDVKSIDELRVPDNALIAGAAVVDRRVGQQLGGKPRSVALTQALAEARMFKDEWEISEIKRAVSHTIDGFASVAREFETAKRGGGERWLQGTFDRHARTHGQAPGYATIIGGGSHAPFLHWVRADGDIRDGELVLLDMGVENRSGYTADITRTLPISGTYSSAQRDVHDLVERAHLAALGAVKPGAAWGDFQDVSMRVLAEGLHDWGILPVSVDEAMFTNGQQHRRYIVCSVGHHVGLDVHDCEAAPYDKYLGANLAPGMVHAVEPGLYFHHWDETLPPELRGIGVRIEDNVLVTDSGHEVLSQDLPINASEIEHWMHQETSQNEVGR